MENDLFNERLEKERTKTQAWANMGTVGNAKDQSRPLLRDRVRAQIQRAESEMRRAEALTELEYLFDKHPDVARILELMEKVKELVF